MGFRIYVTSNGCIPNCLEGKAISDMLSEAGHDLVDSAYLADLIILNACGYSSAKIADSLAELTNLEQIRRPGTKIILTGCLYKICSGRTETHKDVISIDFCGLNSFFHSASRLDRTHISSPIDNPRQITGRADIFHIVTSTGCLGECTYCAIKRARGRIESRPISSVLEDVESGLARGFSKIILWGDDLGAYGTDRSENLTGLLDGIIREFGSRDIRLFLHRINPQWLIRAEGDICRILKAGIISLIYSPVQSGSDRILRLMKRPYTRDEFLKVFRSIKNSSNRTILKTDIMTGFPSENDDDFHMTLDIFTERIIDDAEIFMFGAIENTPAFSMLEQVDEKTKTRRRDLLWKLAPYLRFYLRRENSKYSLIDRGNINEEGLCWTLQDVNPDYYE